MARQHMSNGELVPDQDMLALMMARLAGLKGNWLLDGFPRTCGQAVVLDSKAKIDFCFFLDVPESVSFGLKIWFY